MKNMTVKQAVSHMNWRYRIHEDLWLAGWSASRTLKNSGIIATVSLGIAGSRSVVSQVLLGGDIWKEFADFRNPYEEIIQTYLEMHKKWVGTFNSSAAQAMSEKGRIESLMSQIVAEDEAARRSPPQGIGYGGLSITRPLGQP
jgi:hypothetical protein